MGVVRKQGKGKKDAEKGWPMSGPDSRENAFHYSRYFHCFIFEK